MVVRSAVGALCAVAALGAVAMALPEHTASKATAEKKDPPFGELTKVAFTPAAISDAQAGSAAQDDKSKLVKLASLSVVDRQKATEAQVSALPAIEKADTTPSQPPVTQPTPTASSTIASDQGSGPADAAKPSETAVATAEPQADAEPADGDDGASAPGPATPVPPSRTKPRSGAIDINRASEDALDHLPGGGRIGHSIVKHRPYRTIEDLVHKRVLRLGAFQRIQSVIRAD